MEKKQELIAKMLELQHLFEEQSDVTSQAIVASIKQVIDKVADKRIQGVNIAPQVLPIGGGGGGARCATISISSL